MCLYTASATPVLPTCCTTRQGPASSSSRMHDSCSCHICTRLQRGTFLLPSPLKAMQLNTHSSWSNTCERSQDESSTQPPPAHTGPAGCCLMDRRAGHPMATTMHTHQPTAQPGSRTKPQHPQLAQTPPKPPNPVPDIRQVCKMTCHSQNMEGLKKFLCQREPTTDIPEQFCTLTALLYITSGIKWWKEIPAEQSQSCPPYLAAPPR